MSAFAVFCADDGSLTFYKRDTVPAVGDEFEGKVVGAVYTGFESGSYSSYKNVPWYNERASILSVSFVDEIAPEDTIYWFYGASSMTSFDCGNLNTDNVTDMGYMFRNCSNLTSLDLSGLNTSNVTDIYGMFNGCSALTTLDLSNFDTSNVTDMGYMFNGCSALTTLDLSNFDTSNVTDMEAMFQNCSALTSLDVSNFDTSNIKNISFMFMNCKCLATLDLSNFDTSNVTNTSYMFQRCNNLTTIYVSNLWTTAAVTNSTNMFRYCTSLIGDIPFDSNYVDATYATYIGGYLTNRALFDYLIKGGTLMDLADKIRVLSAKNDSMNPIQMSEVLAGILDAKEVLF